MPVRTFLYIAFMTIFFLLLNFMMVYPVDHGAVERRLLLSDTHLKAVSADSIRYYDGHAFTVIGRYHDEKTYARFPARYKNTLRDKVWSLGQHSAGISIRFRTNASTIMVRWTLLNDAHLPHMPDTGVKGVDLYVYAEGRWQYVRTGFPREKSNEASLLSYPDAGPREYLLTLPLYDGVETLEIGVPLSADISRPREGYLVEEKPVVYYGTSIAQGGCASRPGLAFTNILSRAMDRSFVNLGFSGNGTIETSVGEAMGEIDAALFVIDCNPNTQPELIYDRTIELVKMLKQKRPDVPILLLEGFLYTTDQFNPEVNETVRKKQKELRRAFETLRKSRTPGLHYQKADNFIGDDYEGTVDGVHPNDLGMMRIADALLPVIKKIL